jgi:hypothetical protein
MYHFAESLSGASSIRGYEQKNYFKKANLELIYNHSKPWFHNTSSAEWLGFRLSMLLNFVFTFFLALLLSVPEGLLNPCKVYITKAFCDYRRLKLSKFNCDNSVTNIL